VPLRIEVVSACFIRDEPRKNSERLIKMGVDWDEVEKLVKPNPDYLVIIKRLTEVFSYGFVIKSYNHSMKEAEVYATKLLGCDPRNRYGEYLAGVNEIFKTLDELGTENYQQLIGEVDSETKLEEFYARSKLSLGEIIGVLKYLQYWVLPSKIYLRELIDKDNHKGIDKIAILRENGIRFTLDILETGCTKRGRKELSIRTEVLESFIYEMVNRADFTRMPYIRGSTVRNYFHAGYKSINQLSNASLETLTNDMTEYGNSIGKNLKHGMELDSGIAISKVIPKLVEH
jgi:hypothetical protein